jgi:hypothetical protein
MKGKKGCKIIGYPRVTGVIQAWFNVTYAEPRFAMGRYDDCSRFTVSTMGEGEPHELGFIFFADTSSYQVCGEVKDLFWHSEARPEDMPYGIWELHRRRRHLALGERLQERVSLFSHSQCAIEEPDHTIVNASGGTTSLSFPRRKGATTEQALYSAVAFLLRAIDADSRTQLSLMVMGKELFSVPKGTSVDFYETVVRNLLLMDPAINEVTNAGLQRGLQRLDA